MRRRNACRAWPARAWWRGRGNGGRGGNGGSAGAGGRNGNGGNGGSGIVIIRYSGSQGATGGTVTSSGGYSIHTFTGDDTFRANATAYLIN